MPDRAPPWLRRSEQTRLSSASDDEVGGCKARSAQSERSERSNQGRDSPRRTWCLGRTGRPSVITIKTRARTAPPATTVHWRSV
jgi:hypothetical protein